MIKALCETMRDHPEEFTIDDFRLRHVPPSAHINVHPYCLHIWRPQVGDIPTPPGWMVA